MRKLMLLSAIGSFLIASELNAQVVVQLPDTSQGTTLSADVSEQAKVTVPATVNFAVTDISSNTTATAAALTVTDIVLATATKQLKISVAASAANFTPSQTSATTWAASDVTWTAGSWTNATGSTGTLANGTYNTVATCTADAAGCSTTSIPFVLAAKTTVKRSGSHTLAVTWKFESIGS